MKLAPSPDGKKLKVLLLVVDDESGDSMNSGVVPSNVLIWSMTNINARGFLVHVNPMNDAKGGLESPANKTDLDGVNLTDGGD